MFNINYCKRQDIGKIKFFYEKAYPDLYKNLAAEFFDWMYLNNPYKKDEFINIVAVQDDTNNEIIAHEGLYRDTIKLLGKSHNVVWGTDLFVLPEYRGRGLAKNIHDFIHDSEELYLAISMAENTRKLLEQFNHIYLKSIYSLVITRNETFYSNTKIQSSLLKNNLSILGKILFVIVFKFRIKLPLKSFIKLFLFKGKKINIVSNNIISCEFNNPDFLKYFSYLTNVNEDLSIIDPKVLEWKYTKQPGKSFKLYVYHKNNKITGYIIFSSQKLDNFKIGVISDVCCSDKIIYNELIRFSTQYFFDSEHSAVFILESDRNHLNELYKIGYVRINQRKPIIISKKFSVSELGNLKKSNIRFNYESHDMSRYFNFRY